MLTHAPLPLRSEGKRIRDNGGRTIAHMRPKASPGDRAMFLGAPAALALLHAITSTNERRRRNAMAIYEIEKQRMRLDHAMKLLLEESKDIEKRSQTLLSAAADFLRAMPRAVAA